MGRTVLTVKPFIDLCKRKGYKKGFRILDNGDLEIYTPRYKKKTFDTDYEEVHKDYEEYNHRKYRGYSQVKDNIKAAIKKSRLYKVISNEDKRFIFREIVETVSSPGSSGYESGVNSPCSLTPSPTSSEIIVEYSEPLQLFVDEQVQVIPEALKSVSSPGSSGYGGGINSPCSPTSSPTSSENTEEHFEPMEIDCTGDDCGNSTMPFMNVEFQVIPEALKSGCENGINSPCSPTPSLTSSEIIEEHSDEPSKWLQLLKDEECQEIVEDLKSEGLPPVEEFNQYLNSFKVSESSDEHQQRNEATSISTQYLPASPPEMRTEDKKYIVYIWPLPGDSYLQYYVPVKI